MINKIDSLSVIVFSKDRPLQLKAYLDSLLHYSNISPSDITVLYTNSPQLKYDELVTSYPLIKWIKETSFFKDLDKEISNAKPYIMFGCDDVIFKSKIDFKFAISAIENDDEIFGFSLRLGKNLNPHPSNFEDETDFLKWNWKECNTPHWDYPWELDSTIYRKPDVLNIISRLSPEEIKNPNYFESVIASDLYGFPIKPKLASLTKSACVVLTINRVQDDFLNSFDNVSFADVNSLYLLYEQGITLDFLQIERKSNTAIHVGAEFFMMKKGNKSYMPLRLRYDIFMNRIIYKIKSFIS